MASRYYGINKGQTEFAIVEGSSTNSTNIELVVNLASSPSREDVILALEKFENYIISHIWPPA